MKIAGNRYESLDRSEWDGQAVIALGDVRIDPKIPRERVLSIPRLDFVKPAKLCSRLPDEFWKKGVLFVTPREAAPDEAEATLAVQKHVLVRAYNAYFHSRPVNDIDQSLTPMLGGLKDPTRSLSQLRNYPWLLRYPLADKLRGLGAGRPALILLAGPGLKEILPRLPELAERCVVICIARTLRLCLDAGVEPDFVVQYDTNPEQRRFYAGLPRLERTALVSLSSAHVHPVAGRFRGVFWRASFNQVFLPNTFVLRDGVEGSIIACLGLAEVLGSSEVYVSGADLSWPPAGDRYAGNGGASGQARTGDVRVFCRDGLHVCIGRRDGAVVHSSIGFVAAALKAGEAASEISESTGARFFTLSPATMLPEESFPDAEVTDALAHAPLDRAALLASLDKALERREPVHLRALWSFLRDNTTGLETYLDLFLLKRLDPASREKLDKEPIVQLLRNMRGAGFLTLNDPIRSAERLLRAWRAAYADAARWALAHILAARGAALPLLCMEEEEQGLRRVLDRLMPGCRLEVRRDAGLGHGADGTEWFDDRHLPRFLEDGELLLVSPGVMEGHAYFWELAPEDKVLDLRGLGAME